MRQFDVFIAGAQKSGTSSLSYYLEQHPSIKCHKPREISYFVRDRAYEKDFPSVFQEYYQDGVGQDQLVLAKSVDLAYIEKAAQRLKEHSPDCKIVMALRDPIDRAYSAYWHMRREGWETKKTFEKALSVEEKRKKKRRGGYCNSLQLSGQRALLQADHTPRGVVRGGKRSYSAVP